MVHGITTLMTPLSLRELICQKRFCRGGDYLRGGLIKFKDAQVYKGQYLMMSFCDIKYFSLNVNRDGIKEEKFLTVVLVKC